LIGVIPLIGGLAASCAPSQLDTRF
jgi:hypothetical protein